MAPTTLGLCDNLRGRQVRPPMFLRNHRGIGGSLSQVAIASVRRDIVVEVRRGERSEGRDASSVSFEIVMSMAVANPLVSVSSS